MYRYSIVYREYDHDEVTEDFRTEEEMRWYVERHLPETLEELEFYEDGAEYEPEWA